jgi:hypothetical protein
MFEINQTQPVGSELVRDAQNKCFDTLSLIVLEEQPE